MPCIQVYTNKSIGENKQKLIKENFGKAIECIPGKTEQWLMCVFHSECDMWFQGEKKDIAFLEIAVYGSPEEKSIDQLTKELMRIISDELEIRCENIYFKYSMTPYWGWNGKNLGR